MARQLPSPRNHLRGDLVTKATFLHIRPTVPDQAATDRLATRPAPQQTFFTTLTFQQALSGFSSEPFSAPKTSTTNTTPTASEIPTTTDTPAAPVTKAHGAKILNLSDFKLSSSQVILLARGLKFTPSPPTNLSDIQTNVDHFVRRLRLTEFFHNTPTHTDHSIVSNSSNFLPPKHQNYHLDTVIDTMEAISSPEILQSHLPNNTNNLNHREISALKTLKSNSNIIIKEADKGSTTVIMNKQFYIDKMTLITNNPEHYTTSSSLEESNIITTIKNLLKAHGNLTKNEVSYLTNFISQPSNLYGLPKIHKSSLIQNALKKNPNTCTINILSPQDLTFRPIVAGPCSPTHRLSNFLHIIFASLIPNIPSHIRDSIHFLSKLPTAIPPQATLCTMDVINLYTNIPHTLGIQAITHWLSKLDPQFNRFSQRFILDALNIILENNIFQFNGKFYRQIKGTAMGTKCAPYYATLTLAYLETEIILPTIHQRFGPLISTYFLKNFFRYLDDCFIIWPHEFPPVNSLMEILNNAHPAIQFTSELSASSVPFLDILVKVNTDNTLSTDIYRKPTDAQNYVHFHSAHPSHTKRNIPYTLCRRICTIVSNHTTKLHRLQEVKQILKSKMYPERLIDDAINKSLSIPTQELRTPKVNDANTHCIPLTLTYNPNNPQIAPQIRDLFTLLKTNQATKQIFTNHRIQASLRQPPNLKKLLTSAKIKHCTPSSDHQVTKCKRPRCKCCLHIVEGSSYHFSQTNTTFKVSSSLNCLSKFVIYTLSCNTCHEYYVGLTTNSLCARMTTHRQQIENPDLCHLNVSKHIASCSRHLTTKFSVFPIYQVKNANITTLRRKETHFITLLKPTLNST